MLSVSIGTVHGVVLVVSLSVPTDEILIVLLDAASEQLEEHHQEDDANAGTGHHACAADAPGGGDEAGIDCVPIPEHLGFHWSVRCKKLAIMCIHTSILQSDIIWDEWSIAMSGVVVAVVAVEVAGIVWVE